MNPSRKHPRGGNPFNQAGDHLPLAIHITPAPDIPIPHDCPPEGCVVP